MQTTFSQSCDKRSCDMKISNKNRNKCCHKKPSMNFWSSLLVLIIGISVGLISTQSLLVVEDDDLTSTNGLANFSTNAKAFFRCYPADHHENIDLKMDEALVVFRGDLSEKNFSVYAQTDVCYQCPLINVTSVVNGTNVSCIFSTSFSLHIQTVEPDDHTTVLCNIKTHLTEGVTYDQPDNEDEPCAIKPRETGGIVYLPIYVALAILVGLGILFLVLEKLHRKGYLYRFAICMPHERRITSDLGSPAGLLEEEELESSGELPLPGPPAKQRLKSLDTFRGLSLVVMIFVNYKGGGYWFFHHSAWNGLTVADLVFPWFVFIMGTSIALAFHSLAQRGTQKRMLLWKVTKRTVILFTLGLMISNNGSKGPVQLKHLRIPGVLQRLALTYFIVAAVHLLFASRYIMAVTAPLTGWRRYLRDLWPYWPEWLIQASFITLHCCLTFCLKVHNCPVGYLGPGGLQHYDQYENCTGGAAGHIDRTVLGENHMYQHPTTTVPYQTSVPYDPEGILGTLTSVFMCFLGLQAGKIIVVERDDLQRIARWAVWALITGALAGGLCRLSQEGGVIPVNKNLWSLSFVLALSSMAFVLLIVCYVLIDVKHWWSGAPFIYPGMISIVIYVCHMVFHLYFPIQIHIPQAYGMNSIVIYMCHEVFHPYFPIQISLPQTHAWQLFISLWGTLIWVAVAGVMYYKQVFIAI